MTSKRRCPVDTAGDRQNPISALLTSSLTYVALIWKKKRRPPSGAGAQPGVPTVVGRHHRLPTIARASKASSSKASRPRVGMAPRPRQPDHQENVRRRGTPRTASVGPLLSSVSKKLLVRVPITHRSRRRRQPIILFSSIVNSTPRDRISACFQRTSTLRSRPPKFCGTLLKVEEGKINSACARSRSLLKERVS